MRSSSVVGRAEGAGRRRDAEGGGRLCAEGVGLIFPTNRVWIVVATKPVKFRKNHEGLVADVKNTLRRDTIGSRNGNR